MITRGVSGQPVAGKPVSGFPAGDFPLEEGVDAPSWLLLYSADATSILVGDTVHFIMTIRNRGTLDATTVVIENIVSAEFSNILNLTSTAGTPSLLGNTITLNLASIAPAAEVVIEFDADAVSAGTPQDRYTVDCAELPQALSAGIVFDIQVPAPIWQDFLLSIDPITFGVGETSAVSISFTNVGNSPATNVVMDCPIPASLGNIQNLLSTHGTPTFSAGSVTLSLASVPAAQTTTITFDMDGVSAASPTIQATLDSTELVQELSNSIPLTITNYSTTRVLSADAATVNPGDILEYTALITNTGANDLTNSVYTDLLSDLDLTLVPGSVTTTKGTIGSGVTVNIGTLLTTDAVTITYQATVNAGITPPDTVSTQGTLTTTELGAQLTNQVDVSVEAAAFVDWSYTLSVIPASLDVGDTTDFLLTLENTGNSTATNVLLSIDHQAFLGNVTALSASDGTPQVVGDVVSVAPGDMIAGKIVTLSFTAEALTADQQNLNGVVTCNEIPSENSNTIQVTTSHIYSSTRTLLSNVVGDANPGDTITYTATITNTSTDSLTLSVYEDELTDANLTVVNGSAITDKGTVTQDDTRIEINLGTFAPAEVAIITYQALIAAGMTVPGTVSAQGTLTTAELGIENTNQVTDNVVAASTGDEDISSNWSNLGFETDMLSPGNSQIPATDWTFVDALNPSDGIGAYDGNNVGALQNLVDRAVNQSNYVATPGTYRIEMVFRLPGSYVTARQVVYGLFNGAGAISGSNAVGGIEAGVYEWAFGTSYSSLNFTSDRFDIQIEPEYLYSAVPQYVDNIKVTKLADFHPADAHPVNSSGVLTAGVSCWADPYTLGQPARRYAGKSYVQGDLIQTIPRYCHYSNRIFQFADTIAKAPIWRNDGAMRFDGVDDRAFAAGVGAVDTGIGDEPFTVVMRFKLLSGGTGYRGVLQLTKDSNDGAIYISHDTDELILRGQDVGVGAIPNFEATFLNQSIVLIAHFETGNSFAEIVGGANYPAAGVPHFQPYDVSIGWDVAATKQAPAMDFWGYTIYPGWNPTLNANLAAFYNSLDGSQP